MFERLLNLAHEDRPQPFVEAVAGCVQVDRVEHRAPDIVLALLVRAVADADGTRSFVAPEVVEDALLEFALAANQGLIYVLSMVVVGALVGAGALGYDVVAGLNQQERFGKGLAAGLTLVVLGIVIDRITQAAARRTRGGAPSRAASGH